jgi:anti-sigma regulatory factor (Ser/Thr protein kinase)
LLRRESRRAEPPETLPRRPVERAVTGHVSGRVLRDALELGSALPCRPTAARVARALVTGWLRGRVGARRLDDARLLVSELVANSIRHADAPAGAALGITASANDGLIRVEVADAGHHGDVRLRDPDAPSGGWGLQLVDRIAVDWGVTHRRGTEVWFELAIARRQASG